MRAGHAAAARTGEAMRRVHELAERAAAGTINVLITGETGVGKELLAETVHRTSPRARRPVRLPQLRGAVRDAAGERAVRARAGRVHGRACRPSRACSRRRRGGTLFLDEVGELPLATQAKLLRVIETREVARLGSVRAAPHRRAVHRGDQPRSRGRGRARRVPRATSTSG